MRLVHSWKTAFSGAVQPCVRPLKQLKDTKYIGTQNGYIISFDDTNLFDGDAVNVDAWRCNMRSASSTGTQSSVYTEVDVHPSWIPKLTPDMLSKIQEAFLEDDVILKLPIKLMKRDQFYTFPQDEAIEPCDCEVSGQRVFHQRRRTYNVVKSDGVYLYCRSDKCKDAPKRIFTFKLGVKALRAAQFLEEKQQEQEEESKDEDEEGEQTFAVPALTKQQIKLCNTLTPHDISDVFIARCAGKVFFLNGKFLVYNESKCLWQYVPDYCIGVEMKRVMADAEPLLNEVNRQPFYTNIRTPSWIAGCLPVLRDGFLRAANQLGFDLSWMLDAITHLRPICVEEEEEDGIFVQQACVVDLRAGKTRQRLKEDYFTYELTVRLTEDEDDLHAARQCIADWACSVDETCEDQIDAEDKIVIKQHRRRNPVKEAQIKEAIGLSVSGVRTKSAVAIIGPSNSAKSKLKEKIALINGPTHVDCDASLLCGKSQTDVNSHSGGLWNKLDKRIITISEIPEGVKLNSAETGKLVGDEERSIRPPNATEAVLVPVRCNIFVFANEFPVLSGKPDAQKRCRDKFHVIEMNNKFDVNDPKNSTWSTNVFKSEVFNDAFFTIAVQEAVKIHKNKKLTHMKAGSSLINKYASNNTSFGVFFNRCVNFTDQKSDRLLGCNLWLLFEEWWQRFVKKDFIPDEDGFKTTSYTERSFAREITETLDIAPVDLTIFKRPVGDAEGKPSKVSSRSGMRFNHAFLQSFIIDTSSCDMNSLEGHSWRPRSEIAKS